MFVGRLMAATVGAGIVDVGMIVSLGKGPFVEAGPTQLLSSARITTKYKSDRVGLSSAKKFFIEEFSGSEPSFSQSLNRSRKADAQQPGADPIANRQN